MESPRQHKSNIISYLAYPALIALGLLLYTYGAPALLNAELMVIAAVTCAAVCISILEYVQPYKKIWWPNWKTIGNDLLFMGIIQMLLPRLLAYLTMVLLLDNIGGIIDCAWWPGEAHVAIQVACMILMADFFRYWLHRLAHEWEPLWRFHAVHHSPHNLYWFNVGRFHPLDKGLQFLFDALPFILIGVSQEVLNIYFVFYAINGFIQHCNIDMRLGVLNYIISGPELHRWHHSKKVEESNTNYGNNLIVWDLLFGTRYLPSDQSVGDLGLVNDVYPQGFIQQMFTPLTAGADKIHVLLLSCSDTLRNALITMHMSVVGRSRFNKLTAIAREPRSTQLQVLMQIIDRHKHTNFGKDHDFDQITDYEKFRELLPVQNYEGIRPYIEQQQSGIKHALTTEQPVMYSLTSGTVDKPKLIPVLNTMIQSEQRNQQIFSFLQYRQAPRAFRGKMFGIVGAPIEGYLENNIPFGAVSGLFYQNMPKAMRKKYLIPSIVFGIKDHQLKYLLCLRIAMSEEYISYLGSANPSTFLKLQSLMQEYGHKLIEDIRNGDFHLKEKLEPEVLGAIQPILKAKPHRAGQLQSLLEQSQLSIKTAWPYIALLTTWTGGSCGIALSQLKNDLPDQCQIMDLGYLASEMRGTFTLDSESRSGLPVLDENFYEFVEKNQWESGDGEFLLVDQLQQEQDYYIFITTKTGLYRYQIDDIIRVSGTYQQTPLFYFVQKAKGITSITGEKLYESQVLQALRQLCEDKHISMPFFLAQANVEASQYEFYIESDDLDDSFSDNLDAMLSVLNVEYCEKRKSERLLPLKVYVLQSGAEDAYKNHMLQTGQREGQYKLLLLTYKDECDFPLERYI